jgi:hypothetical protein
MEEENNSWTSYRYTSLADTEKFIEENKPAPLAMHEALQRVSLEDRLNG